MDTHEEVPLPGPDAKDGACRNAKAILGMNHTDVGHPGVAVVKANDPPGKWARDYHINAAAGDDARAVFWKLPLTSHSAWDSV